MPPSSSACRTAAHRSIQNNLQQKWSQKLHPWRSRLSEPWRVFLFNCINLILSVLVSANMKTYLLSYIPTSGRSCMSFIWRTDECPASYSSPENSILQFVVLLLVYLKWHCSSILIPSLILKTHSLFLPRIINEMSHGTCVARHAS